MTAKNQTKKTPTPKTSPLVRIKKVTEQAMPFPQKASEHAAGYDLAAASAEEMINIEPGSCVPVPTGYAWEIPKGYVGLLTLRSSRARSGLILANGCGIIDSDYRGEVIMLVRNLSDETATIKAGTRVGQLVIAGVLIDDAVPELVEELTD